MRVKVELVIRFLLVFSSIIVGLNKSLNFIPSLALHGSAGEFMNI